MKLKLKLCLLFIGIAVAFTACKKSASNPSTLAPKDVATQVALNVSQSLFGGLGVDLSNGLDAPSSFAVNPRGGGLGGPRSLSAVHNKNISRGSVLAGLANPDCGLVVDTTLNFSDTSNGSATSIAGSYGFSFTCTNNVVSGFNTRDNLTISFSNASVSFTYKVAENLTLLSLNPSIDDSNLSIKGSLASNGSYQYLTGTKKSGSEVFNYTLSSLIYSPATGNIVSGSAAFTTTGSGPNGTWNYQGTITFLGNQMAKVTINGTAYNVNLQTGVVS